MSGPSDNPLKRLVGEIHRRSLWQVLGIYVVASWAAFEAVQTLTEGLGLPGWLPAFAFVLLIIGLPLVLATAFVQEGGPGRSTADTMADLDDVFSEWETSEQTKPSGIRSVFTWRNALLGGMAAFALGGMVAAGWLVFGGGARVDASDVSPDRPSVAVLPFDNLSPDPDNAYFADGIHEDILAHLSRIHGLTVLARTSVLRYRDTEKSIGQIAAELDADALLEGSVRRAGDQVRIVAELIDPNSEGHLWAETYDRRLDVDNVFAVQTEVARRVTRALQANLSPEEEERIAKRPTESLDAYDLYLQGREAYSKALEAHSSEEEEENEEAIRLFRRALELDPDYALAWAGLADAYATRVSRFGHPREWADSALQAARRSIELDPDLAEGHKARGGAYAVQDRLDRALDAYQEALDLDPDHYGALHDAAGIHLNFGRFDEAIRLLRRVIQLAPNEDVSRRTLAHHYKFLGLDDAAMEWMEAVLVLDLDDVGGRLLGAQFAVYRGDTGEALARAEEIVADAPDDARAWTGAAGMAYMVRDFELAVEWARESLRLQPGNDLPYWHSTETLLGISLLEFGERTEGRRVLSKRIDEIEERLEAGEEDWKFQWDLAAAHAALGDTDAALDRLERAYEFGFRFARWPPIDPAFGGLRDERRYRDWLARIEDDVAEMRERVVERERAAGIR